MYCVRLIFEQGASAIPVCFPWLAGKYPSDLYGVLTRNSVLYLLLLCSTGSRGAVMAWAPFRGPVGGRPFGLSENGLSLKGSFVFAGRDKQQAGPRRSSSRPGPAKTRYRTGERKPERDGELEKEGGEGGAKWPLASSPFPKSCSLLLLLLLLFKRPSFASYCQMCSLLLDRRKDVRRSPRSFSPSRSRVTPSRDSAGLITDIVAISYYFAAVSDIRVKKRARWLALRFPGSIRGHT